MRDLISLFIQPLPTGSGEERKMKGCVCVCVCACVSSHRCCVLSTIFSCSLSLPPPLSLCLSLSVSLSLSLSSLSFSKTRALPRVTPQLPVGVFVFWNRPQPPPCLSAALATRLCYHFPPIRSEERRG